MAIRYKRFSGVLQLLAIGSILAMLMMPACQGDPEWDEGREFDRALEGKWESAIGSATSVYQIKDDGTYTFTVYSGATLSTSEAGQGWTMGNHLNFLNSDKVPTTYIYRVENRELLLWTVGHTDTAPTVYRAVN